MKIHENKYIQILLTVCVLLLIFGAYTVVSAQSPTSRTRVSPKPTPLVVPNESPPSGVDMTLSPTFLSLITDPGKEVTSQFKVRNNNTFTEYLRLKLVKYEASANGGSPVIADIDESDPFLSWITFSSDELSLSSRETKTIKVNITPPKDASLGYYYAIVVTRISPPLSNEGAVVSGSPAISLLLNVKSPNAKRELQIVDFKTDKYFYEYLPTTFTVAVKNTGNVHVVPVGDVFIDWGGKKEIAVLPMNRGNGNILPQTTRSFDTAWNEGFAVRVPKMDNGRPVLNDKGKPKFETKYDFQKADLFRIGKYTGNLILVYDNGERDIPIEATVSFWVIPWKILLIGGVILIFALLGIKNALIGNIRKLQSLFRK